MNELPDKITRIDVIRVEYRMKKLCECVNPHYLIDYQNRLVYCEDCGGIVDPFEALTEIARNYARIGNQVERLLDERRQIENYKPHLVVFKNLERHYRANHFSMIPVCPHCGQAFDITEIIEWRNRKMVKSIPELKERNVK